MASRAMPRTASAAQMQLVSYQEQPSRRTMRTGTNVAIPLCGRVPRQAAVGVPRQAAEGEPVVGHGEARTRLSFWTIFPASADALGSRSEAAKIVPGWLRNVAFQVNSKPRQVVNRVRAAGWERDVSPPPAAGPGPGRSRSASGRLSQARSSHRDRLCAGGACVVGLAAEVQLVAVGDALTVDQTQAVVTPTRPSRCAVCFDVMPGRSATSWLSRRPGRGADRTGRGLSAPGRAAACRAAIRRA